MMDFEERIEIADERQKAYQTFSTLLFQEPTKDLLLNLRSLPFNEGKLGDYISELSDMDMDQARIDAVADFAALFQGMSALPVAPYESVYTSPEHLLMQDSRDEVVKVYQDHGYKVDDPLNLPEDHISTELEFMARLCDMEKEAWVKHDEESAQKWRSSQKAFLDEHLAVWVPKFCSDVESRSRTGLYAGVVEMLCDLVTLDSEELKV